MENFFTIVSEFDSNGKHMYVIMSNGNAHVIDDDDMEMICNSFYPKSNKKSA